MNSKFLRASVGLLCMMVVFVYESRSYPAPSEGCPIIHVRQTSHTFPTVFEGEKLSHTFTVFNQGTANLDIKRVTSS